MLPREAAAGLFTSAVISSQPTLSAEKGRLSEIHSIIRLVVAECARRARVAGGSRVLIAIDDVKAVLTQHHGFLDEGLLDAVLEGFSGLGLLSRPTL